ncbi:hypothetical protein AAF712_011231 [Marasmius tenuissimus]|uniref:Circumsporozoite protein n=1 Tax=Marasmius tenuissimus TaxID=585030 RepID=A0ABR2ZNI4_9AGAR
MFAKSKLALAVIAVLAVSDSALGRIRWLERDGRAVQLHPRRFGQENPAVIQELSQACPGQVCGTLSGAAITPLLAAQPECSQQDMADQIIDAAQQFDDATKQTMIDIAIRYRQAEKNTPPDFTTNPPTARNSVFCQKAPKNAELNGLVQAQDPANDPNIFFDPATKASVQKGSQANTEPFGGAGANNGNAGGADNGNAGGADNGNAGGADNGNAGGANNGNAGGAAGNDGNADNGGTGNNGGADTGNNGNAGNGDAGNAGNGGANNGGAGAGAIGDFGSCSIPEVEFGVGFDNRKETSFQPVDKASFDHGSAQGFGIISKFICDTLTNKCGADQTAKDTCAQASAAADAAAAKTGAQADAFNAAFGITTNFANVQAIDDQGRPVGAANGNAGNAGANNGNAGANDGNAGANNGNTGADNGNANTGNNDNGNAGANNGGAAAGGIGNFGSCSVPEIEFGVGFDGRKETSFQPVDKASFDHGSAQAFGIISQFVCDTLTNKCGADQAAKDTCAQAVTASNAAPAKTGAQADAFNAAFGKTTNFASVQAIDNQGKPVV